MTSTPILLAVHDIAERIRRARQAIAEDIHARLERSVADPRWPRGARLFLFGSRARGDAATGSDVDVLVCGATSERDRLLIDQILRHHLDRWPLDLVFLDHTQEAHNVERGVYGKVIEIRPMSMRALS